MGRGHKGSPENLPAKPEEAGLSAKALSHLLESSARLQAPAVRAYVARLRRANPDALFDLMASLVAGGYAARMGATES
jgi:hypothetical protein